MMTESAIAILISWARGSDPLRRLAMGVAAVTILKVFFIDMDGLTGLVRVFSFVGLGLALTALAWFNKLVRGRTERAGSA